MRRRKRGARPEPPAPEGDPVDGALSGLLELERRIEAEVAAARDEAARTLESARSAATSLAAEEDGSFEAALDQLRRMIDAEADATIASLERDADSSAETFLRVDAPTLDRLVRELSARILGGGAR